MYWALLGPISLIYDPCMILRRTLNPDAKIHNAPSLLLFLLNAAAITGLQVWSLGYHNEWNIKWKRKQQIKWKLDADSQPSHQHVRVLPILKTDQQPELSPQPGTAAAAS